MEMNRPTTTLTTLCREALASLRTGAQRAEALSPTAIAHLTERGLVAEHTDGLVEATRSAAGYCSDPSTFEA